jgi:hypothetical protein
MTVMVMVMMMIRRREDRNKGVEEKEVNMEEK